MRLLSGAVNRPRPRTPSYGPRLEYGADLGPISLDGLTAFQGFAYQLEDYETFISGIQFDSWVGGVIGTAEGGFNMYGYALGDPTAKPPILIVSSVHGDEPQAAYGARRFCEFLDDPDAAPANQAALHALRDRFSWFWVPVASPSAFEAGTRTNVNGVNVNRDYQDLTQAETRLIVAEAQRLKPVAMIDCHTYLGPPHALGAGWGPGYLERPLLINAMSSLTKLRNDTVGEYLPHPDAADRLRTWALTQTSVRGVPSIGLLIEAARVKGDSEMAEFTMNALLVWSLYVAQWDQRHHD